MLSSGCRSKLHTYDDVVEKVAQHLGLDDPSKIRLTSHNCYSQQPKPQPIKYRGVDHLSDMLVHYNQVLFTSLIFRVESDLIFSSFSSPLSVFLRLLFPWFCQNVFYLDFRYPLLRDIGHPSPGTARLKNFESCFPSCYQRWSKCWWQLMLVL